MKLNFELITNSPEMLNLYDSIAPSGLYRNPSRAPTEKVIIDRRHSYYALMHHTLFGHYFCKGYCYTPMMRGYFTAQPVSYRSFNHVQQTLVNEALLIRVTGDFGRRPEDKAFKEATRFYPTLKLLDLVDSVCPERQQLLDKLEETQQQILVFGKYCKPKKQGKEKVNAKKVPQSDLSRRPGYNYHHNRILTLNKHYKNHHLEGIQFNGLRRSFNEIRAIPEELSSVTLLDEATYGLFAGGRLYTIGDSYQKCSAEKRLTLKIDHSPVVEIDIKASHLSIALYVAMATTGGTYAQYPQYDFEHSDEDPYAIEGIPRELVKACSTQLLSKKLRHNGQWGEKGEEALNMTGSDIRFSTVVAALKDKHPVLFDPKAQLPDWEYLQRRESDVIMATLTHLLVEHDIPAYPVHDSILVRQEDEAFAAKTLKEHFRAYLGFIPALKVSRP